MAQDIQQNASVREIFDELFSLLETLETQNVAILQFLKEEGIATDERLAPYLDRAANTASVKWRAHRARMEHLFSPIPAAAQDIKKERESGGKKEEIAETRERQGRDDDSEKSRQTETTKDLGASNPITGRRPWRESAAVDARNKTSKGSETAEGEPGGAADREAASGADSTHPPEPKASQEETSRPGESAPRQETGTASAAKRQ